jgi:hypothetical protein
MNEQPQFTLARFMVAVAAFSVTFGLFRIWLQRDYFLVAAGEALVIAILALVLNRRNAREALVALVGLITLIALPLALILLFS